MWRECQWLLKGIELFMGVESFYIKIERRVTESIEELLKSYNQCFDYSYENDYFCIEGTLIDFFPATEIIYNVLNEIKERPFFITSLGHRIYFDFETYTDFFSWMYNIWKDKIHCLDKEWGAFMIKPSEFYKAHRVLKKYYKKFAKE